MHRLYLLTLTLVLTSLLPIARAAESPRPNVLLITADDLGWDSLGCTGNPLPGITPHLDQLADEGLLIHQGHIVTPICGPSREAIYTELYPQSSGYMGHGTQPPSWWLAREGNHKPQTSITTELQKAGYFTGLVGKHGSTACQFSSPPIGDNASTGMGRSPARYYEHIDSLIQKAKAAGKPFFISANTHDPHRYWAQHPSETPQWIAQSMGSSSRWQPLTNGKPYPDPAKTFDPADCPLPASYPQDSRLREPLSYYYGSVHRMDQVVGEILRALDEHGLADDTLTIFLSDHGLAWELSKWSLYPAGTRTPIILKWPAHITPATVDDRSIVSAADLAPTIAEACGLAPLPDIDGLSFWPRVIGKTPVGPRAAAFSCFNYMNNRDEQSPDYLADEQYRPSRALSTARYTYVWNGWSDGQTTTPPSMGTELINLLLDANKNAEDTIYPSYKARALFIKQKTKEELYDTLTDPGCLKNLVNGSGYQKQLQSFRAQMVEILEKTGDHELQNYQAFLDNPPPM